MLTPSLHTISKACGLTLFLLAGCSAQLASSVPSSNEHPSDSESATYQEPDRQTQRGNSLAEFPSSDYFLGTGRGDLSRGSAICLRTADMAARAELAKLIRVEIKERSIDRARERTGRTIEQDIEVVREEQVNELLKEVKIVDRLIDKASGVCVSTAAMPRQRTATAPASPSN